MAKKRDTDIDTSPSSTEATEGEARVYELGFHIDSDLPVEEVKKTYQALREVITKAGTIVAEGEPQAMPLAYTISRQEPSGRRDFSSAYFCWIAYEASVVAHEEVLAAITAEKRVIRFIDLITTKDAARHAAEAQELARKTAERTKKETAVAADADEPSSEELDAALEHALPADQEASLSAGQQAGAV